MAPEHAVEEPGLGMGELDELEAVGAHRVFLRNDRRRRLMRKWTHGSRSVNWGPSSSAKSPPNPDIGAADLWSCGRIAGRQPERRLERADAAQEASRAGGGHARQKIVLIGEHQRLCRAAPKPGLLHSRCRLWRKGEANLLKSLEILIFLFASVTMLSCAAQPERIVSRSLPVTACPRRHFAPRVNQTRFRCCATPFPATLGFHIAVAWKASETAELAVAAALPLLHAAQRVTILIAEEADSQASPRGPVGTGAEGWPGTIRLKLKARLFILQGELSIAPKSRIEVPGPRLARKTLVQRKTRL